MFRSAVAISVFFAADRLKPEPEKETAETESNRLIGR